MNPIDFLGRPIRPGDLIVYPTRRGSSMWMNKLSARAGHAGVRQRLQQPGPRGEDHQPQERRGGSAGDAGGRLMPLYDLECSACGHTFEAFQAMDAKQPTRCEKCGKRKARRVLIRPPATHNKYSPMHPRKDRGIGIGRRGR